MFNLGGIKKGEGFTVCDIFEGEGESLKFKFLKRESEGLFPSRSVSVQFNFYFNHLANISN